MGHLNELLMSERTDTMAKFHILSLDGGGIRGIVTAVLLRRLQAESGVPTWLDHVNLFAGTSTGGLLALGLAGGIGLQRIVDLYQLKGRLIFDDSWLDNLVDLGKVFGADYDNVNLEKELHALLGDRTLGDLAEKGGYVLITAFDLDNEAADPARRRWKPKLFHNLPGTGNDNEQLAYKVGLYTSAAPTYFPSVDGFIDGGVFASNPSMCALAQTQDKRNDTCPPVSELVLLSLGTGTSLVYIEGQELDWGYAQWAKPLVTLMLDGVAGIADYECHRLLGSRYHRLAPEFPPRVSIDMDDVSRVSYMIDFAEHVDLSETVGFLNTAWV
jgi:patatin-like phospholipase/acyl hydrolase